MRVDELEPLELLPTTIDRGGHVRILEPLEELELEQLEKAARSVPHAGRIVGPENVEGRPRQ